MEKKTVSGTMFIFLLVGFSSLTLSVRLVESEPTTIIVPDDFLTIQDAVNSVVEGDTIFVRVGTYYEHLVVNKTVLIAGEDVGSTIIDGNITGHVVNVISDNVSISGFTIQRSGRALFNSGISISSAEHCDISGNRIVNNEVGVHGSPKNTSISNNTITNNHVGVAIDPGATYNIISRNRLMANNVSIHVYYANSNNISENSITNNWRSITLGYSRNNTFYHNFFFNNTEQVLILAGGYANFWDDGYPSGGNYWDGYTGNDTYHGPDQNETGSDGIGDTPYTINYGTDRDNYPLMKAWNWPLLGDINYDFSVDMKDVDIATGAFGTEPGDPLWNPHADITGSEYLVPDRKVEMRDIGLIARNFGEIYLQHALNYVKMRALDGSIPYSISSLSFARFLVPLLRLPRSLEVVHVEECFQ